MASLDDDWITRHALGLPARDARQRELYEQQPGHPAHWVAHVGPAFAQALASRAFLEHAQQSSSEWVIPARPLEHDHPGAETRGDIARAAAELGWRPPEHGRER